MDSENWYKSYFNYLAAKLFVLLTIMKNTCILSFIFIVLAFGCETAIVEPGEDDQVIVGGLFTEYTDLQCSACQTQMVIDDSTYTFNQVEAFYASYLPALEKNNFYMIFTNTQSGSCVELELLTPIMSPEEFFKKGKVNINSIILEGESITNSFFDMNGLLVWDNVFFSDYSFTGQGKFELLSDITDPSTSGIFPAQIIPFEFK